jgi:hypothetical protein
MAFGVSAERWLLASIHDRLARKDLMRAEPVVRLV